MAQQQHDSDDFQVLQRNWASGIVAEDHAFAQSVSGWEVAASQRLVDDYNLRGDSSVPGVEVAATNQRCA